MCFRPGNKDTVFGGRWNTVFWDQFEAANTDGALYPLVTALRERSRMTILSTESDPFDKIEDDVSTFVLCVLNIYSDSTMAGETGVHPFVLALCTLWLLSSQHRKYRGRS